MQLVSFAPGAGNHDGNTLYIYIYIRSHITLLDQSMHIHMLADMEPSVCGAMPKTIEAISAISVSSRL